MTDPFAAFIDQSGDVEVAEAYAARLREWGKWEAACPIYHGNALAANEGDKLPQSNVDRLGWARNKLARLQEKWIEDYPDDPDVKAHLEAQAKADKAEAKAEAGKARTTTTEKAEKTA